MIRFEDDTRRVLPRALRVAGIVLFIVLATGVALASGGEEKSSNEVLKEMAWQTANLALLLGVLFYFGRAPIREFFATRRSGIQTELSQAAELLAEAEQRNSELQRRLVDLNIEIDGIKSTAGQRAQDEAEHILADARATAERIRNDARAAMDQELRRAQTELREEAADLALELAAKKLKDEVSEGDRDRLVDEFILRVEPSASEGANR
jgi:F-type H+-transporting ATPase subunit b